MALDYFRANQSSKASRQQKLKATNEPNLKSFLMFKSQEAICSLSASHCMLKHLTGNIYFTPSAHWYHLGIILIHAFGVSAHKEQEL